MRADELQHSVRDVIPDALVRGEPSLLRAELYLDGVLTQPDSGTVTIHKPDGQELATGSITVADSVATFSVTAAADSQLADQYRVEWSLVVGSETYKHRTRAEVVRRRLVCPISVVDLYRVAPQLDATATDSVSRFTTSDYADFIREGWLWCLVQLRQSGRRPDVISGADALREAALHKSLSFIYGAMLLAGADRFQELYNMHDDKAAKAFRLARIEYAPDDDATARRDRPGRPSSLWLMGT